MEKLKITTLHIENDVVNNQPTLIMTDENGVEWALSHQPVCYEGGGRTVIEKKSESWYFKKKGK